MLINGIFKDTVAINDRALAYGDGLFETIRLYEGHAIYLNKHLNRLLEGCERLGISCSLSELTQDINKLSAKFPDYDVLKVVISRGAGGRGYRPASELVELTTSRILTLHSLPDYQHANEGIHTFLCRQRLALQPALAGMKHLNRLEQVLASREWPSEEFQEGIMLDMDGMVIEGTKSNLFFVEADELITPELSTCGIDGIMRKSLIDNHKLSVKVEPCSLQRLLEASEVFLCNSIFGIWPVLSLQTNTECYHYTPAKFCLQARQVFKDALAQHAI